MSGLVQRSDSVVRFHPLGQKQNSLGALCQEAEAFVGCSELNPKLQFAASCFKAVAGTHSFSPFLILMLKACSRVELQWLWVEVSFQGWRVERSALLLRIRLGTPLV